MSLGLVAYGSSDSEQEDEERDRMPAASVRAALPHSDGEKKIVPQNETEYNYKYLNDLSETKLFGALPKPSQKKVIEEEDDVFLHKKEAVIKPKAQITVPSLSDFRDVDSGLKMKKSTAGSEKKSGLLSMLPEPKFSGSSAIKPTKQLIPNVVERKTLNIAPNHPVKQPTISSHSATQKCKNTLLSNEYSSDDEDDSLGQDFFSINTQPEALLIESVPQEPVETRLFATLPMKHANTESFMDQAANYNIDTTLEQADVEGPSNSHYSHQPSLLEQATSSNDIELDDEALRQLCGSRKRHKKEDIQVITVDQKQVLSDAREWLVKGLMDDTTKRVSSSKKKGNEPTNQQRKKHQITYLAHQAKANEAELQNQWANNKVSRRQTQSKYGF